MTTSSDAALERLVAQLAAETEPRARAMILAELCAIGDVWVAAERLKLEADHMRYQDAEASLAWSSAMEQLGRLARADIVVALAKMTEGLTIFEQDRYVESIDLFDQASSLFRANGHDLGWARTQISRTSACLALARFDEGMQRAEEARPILAAAGDWRRVAALDNNISLLLERMNQPAAALEYSERALSFFLRDEGSYSAAHVLCSRALLLWRLGRVREALDAHAEARDRYIALGARADAAREDVNAGGILLALGRFAEAKTILSSTRRQLLNLGSPYQAARAGILLVECCVRMGRYGDAVAAARGLEQELALFDATADVIVLAVWHGIAHAEEARPDRAMEILNRASELVGERTDLTSYRAIIDLARARLLHFAGRGDEAGPLLDTAIPIVFGAGLEVEFATAKVLRSHLLLDEARYDEGLQAASEAVVIAEREGMEWLAAQALHARGRVEMRQGSTDAARASLSLAIGRMDRVHRVTAWDDRAAFTNTSATLYEDAVALALSRGEHNLALHYVERAKSRALADHLRSGADVRPRPRDENASALIGELRALRERLAWFHARRQGLASYSPSSGHTRGLQNLDDESAAAIEGRIAAIWRELQAAHPVYRRQAAALDLQAAGGDDDSASAHLLETLDRELESDGRVALLEYFGVGADIVVFIATAGDLSVARAEGVGDEIQKLVTLLRLNVSRSAGAVANGAGVPDALTRNAVGILSRLYDVLMRPALRQLAGVTRLVVVPHGATHHVPFHALHDGARYLIEDFEVSYSPCAGLLDHFSARHRLLQDASLLDRQALVVSYSHAGRLPHVDMEGRWVAEALGGRLFSDQEASIAALSAAASSQNVLHIAAHGSFNPEEPMFSSLQLHDGLLSTLDIFDLELNCSLVTLSACETALGVTGAGDELMGLSRAFLFAGTPSLVLSLWMVEDQATAALMREFYRALRHGGTKAAALRQAQLSLLNSKGDMEKDISGPFFWAPFQLIGHAGPL